MSFSKKSMGRYMRDMNHDNKIDSRDHALLDIANESGRTSRPSRSSGTGSSGDCGPTAPSDY